MTRVNFNVESTIFSQDGKTYTANQEIGDIKRPCITSDFSAMGPDPTSFTIHFEAYRTGVVSGDQRQALEKDLKEVLSKKFTEETTEEIIQKARKGDPITLDF